MPPWWKREVQVSAGNRQRMCTRVTLNGRQATELILLSGAAIAGGTGGQPNYPTQPFLPEAEMDNGLTYLLDLRDAQHPYNNLSLPFPSRMLQEFKVETSAVPAQYGQHSAGAVNAGTKSGSNQFHGDAFEFARNKVFNGQRVRSNSTASSAISLWNDGRTDADE
jgi:hypothetical protein